MKNNYLFFLSALVLVKTHSFSQPHAAPGPVSQRGNFTTLSIRPSSIPSAELLNTASETARKHPDFGVLPLNAPSNNCYEVVEKRTATSRHFVVNGTNGNTFCIQNSYGAINYKDKQGYYREKDINIYATSKTGIYASDNQEQPVVIDLIEKSVSIVNNENQSVKFNHGLELWGVDGEGNETFISVADWKGATVGSNGLMVNNIFNGISLEAFAMSGSVKTNFLIGAYSTAYNNFKWLVIKDQFDPGSIYPIQFTAAKEPNGFYNCDADIFSSKGEAIAKIHQGSIFDHSRNNTSSLYYKYKGGKFEMYIDVNYLKNSSTTYPVTVDPLVTSTGTLAQASITGSRYNGSCNFINSCDFPLTFNSPANATINDVTFSMSYQANGSTCWQLDGAMRVSYGACVSPSMSGSYYFCNTIGGGVCSMANASIFTDIAGCLPTPSCTPYPMTFTLKFYRSCWGASGCAAGCIQANSPFIVNVYGQTLETLGDIATGNSISTLTANCAGNATLNPAAANGIGPYTYTWNPSGTQASTYTATVASTQTITCDVTDACGTARTATFIVNSKPTPISSSLPSQMLTPCTTTVTFSPTYTTTITDYNWTGPGIVGASNGPGIVVNTAGIYVLTFTNSIGCDGTNTYTAVNGPASTNASAVSATINCINTTVTLSPVYTPSSDLTYSWAPVGPGTINGSAINPSVVVSQDGIYRVTITNTVSNCQSSATYTVLSDLQAPTISSIPTQTITCSTPTIIISPTYTSSSGLTYSWTGPGLLPPVTTTSISATQIGNYTVVATSANGCSSVAQYSLTGSSALPLATVQDASLTCAVTAVVLNSTVTPLPGTYTYTWSGPGIISGQNSASVTANAPGTYSLGVTNEYNCTASTTCAVINNNTIPTASAVSGTITCANTTVTLSPVYTPSTNLTYSWTSIIPGAIIGSTTGANAVISQQGVYQVVFSNTITGCQSSTTCTVTNDTQAPGISAIPTQTINCTTPAAAIAPTYTASSGLSYNWNGPGITPPIITSSISVTQGGSFTVIAIAANGCSTTAQYSVTGDFVSPTVTVNSGSICAGQSFTMFPTGATTYTYSNNSAIVSPTITSTYTVTGSGLNGCTSAMGAVSEVTVNALPNITMSVSPSATICAGEIIYLNASGALNYTWSPGNYTASAISVTPNISTDYSVVGTSSFGCISSSSISVVVSICAGIHNNASASHIIKIYPNPTNGEFIIEFADETAKTIDIIDVTGRILLSTSIAKDKVELNINMLSDGMYYLKILSNHNTAETFKIVKE